MDSSTSINDKHIFSVILFEILTLFFLFIFSIVILLVVTDKRILLIFLFVFNNFQAPDDY
jgi:hypothetical protein